MRLLITIITFLSFVYPVWAGTSAPRKLVAAGGGGGTSTQVADIQVYESTSGGYSYKVCIWDSAGTLVSCSASITHIEANALRTIAWSGPTLTSSSNYYLGIVSSMPNDFAAKGTWSSRLSNNNFASPTNVAPGTDAGQSMGDMIVSVRNSSGTLLLGLNDTPTSAGTIEANEAKYAEGVYTCP